MTFMACHYQKEAVSSSFDCQLFIFGVAPLFFVLVCETCLYRETISFSIVVFVFQQTFILTTYRSFLALFVSSADGVIVF